MRELIQNELVVTAGGVGKSIDPALAENIFKAGCLIGITAGLYGGSENSAEFTSLVETAAQGILTGLAITLITREGWQPLDWERLPPVMKPDYLS